MLVADDGNAVGPLHNFEGFFHGLEGRRKAAGALTVVPWPMVAADGMVMRDGTAEID